MRAYPVAVDQDWPMPLGEFSIVSMDTETSSICGVASQGCIRLHPDDIEALLPDVGVGERGRIVYEPVLVAFDGTDVFLEVHPDRYGRSPNPLWRALKMIDQLGLRDLVELSDVVRIVREAEGLAVPVTVRR
jgi:L,D-transpeptidase ErfK/SrfK